VDDLPQRRLRRGETEFLYRQRKIVRTGLLIAPAAFTHPSRQCAEGR
jgi:hypothetical protein